MNNGIRNIDDAVKTLGLEWGPGDKIKCDPFGRASDTQKRWRQSAARLNTGATQDEIQRNNNIERADYHVMVSWEFLTCYYCNVCGYVVHPRRFHQHCPVCDKLMHEKRVRRTDDGYPIYRIWCKCGYEEVNVLD